MISVLFKRLETAFAKNDELLTKVTTEQRVKIFFKICSVVTWCRNLNIYFEIPAYACSTWKATASSPNYC